MKFEIVEPFRFIQTPLNVKVKASLVGGMFRYPVNWYVVPPTKFWMVWLTENPVLLVEKNLPE